MPTQTQIVRETRDGRKNRIENQRADEQSRKGISILLNQLHEVANKTRRFESLRKTKEKEKAKLATDNIDEAGFTEHEKVQAKLFLCVYPAAWLFEFLFLGALAEFLMSLGLYDMPRGVILLGRFLIPTAILVADAYFGAQLVASREVAFEKRESAGKYLWAVACICWVFLLGGVAGYTCYVKLATQETFSWGDMWLPLILAALSLCFHCAIVFGGERLRNAKAYLSYSRAHTKLEHSIQQSTAGYDRERAAVSQVYRDYTDALELYNNRNTDAPVGAGPFDQEVVRMVNEIFGPVILPPPAQNNSEHIPPPVRPSADGAATNNAESTATDPAEPFRVQEERATNGNHGNPFDGFHLDVDGRIRDAESEVTA